MKYVPRILEANLSLLLEATGAVVIEGSKACGKTETARRMAASEVLLDLDDNAKRMIDIDAGAVLAGGTPRLIDERQLAPRVWNHVRREVDRRGTPGQFILTGSATPADSHSRHTGAGRFSRLRMRPCTLSESGWSSGQMSLAELLQGRPQKADRQEMTISVLAETLFIGGWAGNRDKAFRAARRNKRCVGGEIWRRESAQERGKAHERSRGQQLAR